MKFFVLFIFCAIQVSNIESKIIPDYLPQPCSKLQSDYSECTFKLMKKLGPYLLKGSEELNFPKLDPLIIPLFTVNRTLQDIVSYSMNLKNIQIWGFDTIQLKSFKFDTQNLNGDLHINMGYLRTSNEYEASARSLRYPFSVNTGGYSKGNVTNIDVIFKFSLKKTEQHGKKYYAFKDFKATANIEGGYIKIISKNSEDQPMADFITNFFNENPKRALAIMQDDFDEALGRYCQSLAELILNAIPADELIPE